MRFMFNKKQQGKVCQGTARGFFPMEKMGLHWRWHTILICCKRGTVFTKLFLAGQEK